MATAQEQRYMNAIASFGCAICRRMGFPGTPGHIHHQRTGIGAGKRASNYRTVCLCAEHHQGMTGLHGMGRKAFERHWGVTELELINEAREQAKAMGVECGDN